MGSVVLENVVTALGDSGLPAALAYPGSPFPMLTQPVAAVHLKQVDSTSRTATVEVLVLCPASLGGAVCQERALEALRVLWALGAVCRQESCQFDRVSQCFQVSLTAAFTQVVPDESGEVTAGFSVAIDDVLQNACTLFRAQLDTGAEPEYVAAEPVAVASHGGCLRWTLHLEEQIPIGTEEPEDPEGEFTLTVDTGKECWQYLGCRWVTVTREYTTQGLRRIRTGFALSRKEG